MPPLTPNSSKNFPKTVISDGDFVLFTPGNPAMVGIEASAGSGTLPTTDAADGLIGSPIPTTAVLVGAKDPSGNTRPINVDVSGNLLTSGGGGGSNPAAGPTGSAVPVSASYTGINVGGNLVGISAASPLPVSAAALPLPTGASTSGLQTSGNASLTSIDGKLTNPLPVGGTVTVIQPTGTNLHVDVDQPLPAGTNVIGHVINDAGSTTVVTGNVAVTNAGLSNIDVALSTRTKPADQQHTIIDSGTTTVTQATGTNLHTVVDSGTVTANIGTSGSLALDASVTGLQVAQGSTTSGQKGTLGQGAVTTAAPTYVTGQTSPLSLDVSGNLRTSATISGTTTVQGAKTNNNAAPGATNVGILPALANAATPSWSEGNQVALSTDLIGSLRTNAGQTASTSAVWTTGTALNTALSISTLGYPSVLITGTATSNTGIISIEGSVDGGVTYPYPLNSVLYLQSGLISISSIGGAQGVSSFNSGSGDFSVNSAGYTNVRVRLSTVLSAGTFTVSIQGSGSTAQSPVPGGVAVLNSITVGNASLTVTQATGTNLHTVIDSGTVTQVSASRTVGNAGALMDAAATPATSPANGLLTLQRYNNTAPAPTNSQTLAIQCDSAGTHFVRPYRRSQYKATPVTITASTTPVTIVAAQGANIFADITGLVVTVTTAATTDIAFTVTLTDGTVNYVFDMDTGALATSVAAPPPLVLPFPSPLPATTANTAWTLASSSATPTLHAVATFITNLAN